MRVDMGPPHHPQNLCNFLVEFFLRFANIPNYFWQEYRGRKSGAAEDVIFNAQSYIRII